MMHLPSTDDDEATEPMPPVQPTDNIIYLQHPTDPALRLKLWRGGVARTLMNYGYTEITEAEYEDDE
jgi:hypothetical protein